VRCVNTNICTAKYPAVIPQMSLRSWALYRRTWQNKGERRPNSTLALSGCPWGQVGGTYPRPKDSNAVVRVSDCAAGKVLEGADRQTDRQTDFTPIIVRLHLMLLRYDHSDFDLILHWCWPPKTSYRHKISQTSLTQTQL